MFIMLATLGQGIIDWEEIILHQFWQYHAYPKWGTSGTPDVAELQFHPIQLA